jgi:hypothetical protein
MEASAPIDDSNYLPPSPHQRQNEQFILPPQQNHHHPPPQFFYPQEPPSSIPLNLDKTAYIVIFVSFILGFFMGKTMQPVILRPM